MRILERQATNRAGYSLLEILVAAVLFSVLVGSIALIGGTGTRLFHTAAARGELEVQARRALGRIQEELLASDHSSLDTFPQAPLWDDRLVFDQPSEFSGRNGAIAWSSTVIEFRYDDGEADDGVDNDGDGLADEGVVVLVKNWNDPDERTIVLCHGVREYLTGETPNGNDDNGNGLIDEKGLCFDLAEENLTLRLSLERRDSEGWLAARTFDSSVWLRN